jgi:RNA polymerase sigma-70 factor (ECF subfamily)
VFAEERTEAAIARRDVEVLLAQLPEAKRALVRRTKIEGLSTAEAARQSGLSESGVKVGVHRALKALSQMIGDKRR